MSAALTVAVLFAENVHRGGSAQWIGSATTGSPRAREWSADPMATAGAVVPVHRGGSAPTIGSATIPAHGRTVAVAAVLVMTQLQTTETTR